MGTAAGKVIARGPEGAFVLFEVESKAYRGSVASYLSDEWIGQPVRDLESLTINGFEAASGWVTSASGREGRYFRVVAISGENDKIYRFIGSVPGHLALHYDPDFLRTAKSFHELSPQEKASLKPKRLRLHRVASGETAWKIAARMPYDDYNIERLMVLNGLSSAVTLAPGDTLKIVTEE